MMLLLLLLLLLLLYPNSCTSTRLADNFPTVNNAASRLYPARAVSKGTGGFAGAS
jgi:hypothetical protein